MVHHKRFAASRRPDDTFISVGRDASPHRFVRDVHEDRTSGLSVCQADAERRRRRAISSLFCEEAERLLGERVKGLLGRESSFAARDGGPEECRRVDGIVTRVAAHTGNLRSHLVADGPQFLFAAGPGQDVAVHPNGQQVLRMGRIQIGVYPLFVDGVGPRIARQGVQRPGIFLEALEDLGRAVQKNHLVVDMLARKQDTHGCGERKQAVAPLGREPVVAIIRADEGRQVVQLGERVQREYLIADGHAVGIQPDVLQPGRLRPRKREIAFDDARVPAGACQLPVTESPQADQTAVSEDTLELSDGFGETLQRLGVRHRRRDDTAPAEHRQVAPAAAALPCGLGQKQVAGVGEELALVEMSFE